MTRITIYSIFSLCLILVSGCRTIPNHTVEPTNDFKTDTMSSVKNVARVLKDEADEAENSWYKLGRRTTWDRTYPRFTIFPEVPVRRHSDDGVLFKTRKLWDRIVSNIKGEFNIRPSHDTSLPRRRHSDSEWAAGRRAYTSVRDVVVEEVDVETRWNRPTTHKDVMPAINLLPDRAGEYR